MYVCTRVVENEKQFARRFNFKLDYELTGAISRANIRPRIGPNRFSRHSVVAAANSKQRSLNADSQVGAKVKKHVSHVRSNRWCTRESRDTQSGKTRIPLGGIRDRPTYRRDGRTSQAIIGIDYITELSHVSQNNIR